MQLENIGSSNPEPVSGLAVKIFYALRSDFETVAEPPAFDAVGAIETKAAIAGDHKFKEGKGFNTITMISESGKIETTPLGERKRKLSANTLTGMIAGSGKQILGFMRMVKNEEFVVLVKEFGTKDLRQLGSDELSAEFTNLTHTIEEAVEGNNALAFTIADKQKWPAPVYEGEVVVLPIVP